MDNGEKIKSKGWPWVQSGLREILGTEKAEKASLLQDGSLLVKTKNETQTSKLLEATALLKEACHVVRDPKLNISKGTIHAPDLVDLGEEEIVQWLSDFGVVGAKRFTKKEGGQVMPTPMILLTFDVPTCPQKLSLDYVTYHVRRHVPNPLLCFQCGKFGHHQERCKGEKKCLNCGECTHEGDCAPRCINCGQEGHSCRSHDCPSWIKEKDICVLKVDNDISYAEARRQYDSTHKPATTQSFVDVVRVPSVSQQIRQDDSDMQEKVAKLEKKIDHLSDLVFQLTKQLSSGCDRSDSPLPQGDVGTEGEESSHKDDDRETGGHTMQSPTIPQRKEKQTNETDKLQQKGGKGQPFKGQPDKDAGRDRDTECDMSDEADEEPSQVIVRSVPQGRGRPPHQRRSWRDL